MDVLNSAAGFLNDGGDMGALMRAYDWASTPLGVPESWPQSLKSALSICLQSPVVSALYWGPEFRMLYNDAYAPALAERNPRALGEPVAEVWSEIWDVLGPQLAGVIKTGHGFSVENQPLMMLRRGKLEETFWVYSFTAIRGEANDFVGVFVTALDNTLQVLAGRRNTAERERMWELSLDLLAVASAEGILEDVSNAWTAVLGWEQSELLGQSFVGFTHPDDLSKTLQVFASIMDAPLVTPYEYRLRNKDGTYRWVAWTAIYDGGKVYASGRDQTRERKQSADLLEEQTTARLREQFIAVLGHDLRNPLSSISAANRMLMAEGQSGRSQQILTLARASVTRMSVLIDNVLDFARGSLGDGISLSRELQPLEPVLKQVADELQIGSDKAIMTAFDIQAPVSFDRSRLGQLVSNLLGNALTHGGENTPVRLEARTAGRHLEISVSNDGDPIPQKVMERLFQPFFRGEVRDNQQGLGLGLFIASEIAKAHDGELSVSSSPEQTRFLFRMPL